MEWSLPGATGWLTAAEDLRPKWTRIFNQAEIQTFIFISAICLQLIIFTLHWLALAAVPLDIPLYFMLILEIAFQHSFFFPPQSLSRSFTLPNLSELFLCVNFWRYMVYFSSTCAEHLVPVRSQPPLVIVGDASHAATDQRQWRKVALCPLERLRRVSVCFQKSWVDACPFQRVD